MIKNWIRVELGEVLKTTSGGTPSRRNPEYYSGSIPWVKSGELNQNTIFDTEEYISEEAVKNSSAKIFPKGTLLIALYGATIGKLAFLGIDAATNQAVCGIFENEAVDSRFLYYFLFHNRRKLIEQGTGGAQPNISQTILKKLPIVVAPLPEQRAIVARIEELFSELDHAVSNLQSAQAKLDIYRQAVLKKAFEGGFNPDIKFDHVQISELCEVVRGGSPRPAGDPKFYDGDIPFLKVADLTRNKGPYLNSFTYTIKEAGLKKTRQVQPFTLLLSNSGATLGVPRISTFETTFNDGIAAFLGLRKEELLYHYYFWTSKTEELRKIDQGAAQPNLNTSLIGSIKIPIASIHDMNQIVQEIESRLSVADKMAETIQTSLEKAEALRQSILKKAFEGRLLSEAEVEACRKEADWEPAEKLLVRIKQEKSKTMK